MNKTITCNIAGLVFYIEENAFEMLSNYLNAVKQRLAYSGDAEEIVQDIESRIAELFSNSISSRQEVILEKNVSEVIAALGSPDEFLADEDYEQPKENIQSSFGGNKFYNSEKTLMRDPENGVIAGVCAGLAAYIGWDVVLVRVLFVLTFILTGFGFLVYIILWVAAPKAQTSADRLRMQGKPINLDTISQEVQEAAERIEQYADNLKTKKKFNQIKEKSKEIGSVLRRVFGVFFFIGGCLGIFFFLGFTLVENGFFIGYDGEEPISLYHYSSIIFNSNLQSIAGWFGLLTTILLPLLFLSISGIFMIFNIRGKVLGRIFLSFLGIWIAGIITFSLVSAQIARDFTHRESLDQQLYSIDLNEITVDIQNLNYAENGDNIFNESGMGNFNLDKQNISYDNIKIEIYNSKDSLFYISSSHLASGFSGRKAFSRAENIKHKVDLDSNILKIAPSFSFPIEDKFRHQKVIVRIDIPKNKTMNWINNKKMNYQIKDYRDKEWE